MSIDYEQLKTFVKEAMFTGGGINEPSAPEGIPHRMPAADGADKEQDMGDPEANELYDIALAAREATEQLVVALDDPVFDGAYENAFKASACLRRVLNDLEADGAHPMPQQRVVAPPRDQQRYSSGGSNAGDYAGGAGMGGFAMPGGEGLYQEQALGAKGMTQSQQAQLTRKRATDVASGDILQGVDEKERAILHDVQALLTQVADEGDLESFRPQLQAALKNILDRSNDKNSPADNLGLGEK